MANALSQYIDFLFDGQIRHFMLSNLPMHIPGIGTYPDFLAFALGCCVTGLMIIGVKESSFVNKMFTLLNVATLTSICLIGATKVDFSNWNLKTNVGSTTKLPNLCLFDNKLFTSFKANTSWVDSAGLNQTCSSNKGQCGTGGFMPFGLTGVLNGAAKCFFAFVGRS